MRGGKVCGNIYCSLLVYRSLCAADGAACVLSPPSRAWRHSTLLVMHQLCRSVLRLAHPLAQLLQLLNLKPSPSTSLLSPPEPWPLQVVLASIAMPKAEYFEEAAGEG